MPFWLEKDAMAHAGCPGPQGSLLPGAAELSKVRMRAALSFKSQQCPVFQTNRPSPSMPYSAAPRVSNQWQLASGLRSRIGLAEAGRTKGFFKCLAGTQGRVVASTKVWMTLSCFHGPWNWRLFDLKESCTADKGMTL